MQKDPDIGFIIDPFSAERPADWNRIPALMQHHRLYYRLEDILNSHREGIPDTVRQEMTSAYRNHLQSQLQTGSELLGINKILSENGVDFLNLKGLALSQELYGNITDRLSLDIDLLIRAADIERSLELLQGLGYSLIRSERDVDPGLFRKVKKNYTLIHPQKRVICELHWELFSNPYLVNGPELGHEDPSSVVIEGQSLPVMNRTNQILYLCLHGTYHEYFRLFWLRDIAEVVNRWETDWDEVFEKAGTLGIARPLRISLQLASSFFGSRDPLEEKGDTFVLQRMCNHLIGRINRSRHHRKADRVRRILFFMAFKKDLRYRRYVLQGIVKRRKIRNN